MTAGSGIRILITRLSHIGDCVLTLPMLTALKHSLPNSFIAWAVESPSHQLLSLHPDLDEIIMIPKSWVSKPKLWPSLRRQLREHRFDIAIDSQGLTKSCGLGYLSGAKVRIGARGQWGRELSTWFNNRLIESDATHIVDRSLDLLTGVNISATEPRFNLPVCPKAESVIDDFLNNHSMAEPFAVINPGASWPSKRWENDRFAIVGDKLYQESGIRSVITWAGDDERAMAEQIAFQNRDAMVVSGRTSLRELAALCQRAGFFIGCDTGPMHIAAAMDTPCIGLYGTTRPQDSGAYGPGHFAIQKRYHSGTSRERRAASNDAMREITPQDVLAACFQMIARNQAA